MATIDCSKCPHTKTCLINTDYCKFHKLYIDYETGKISKAKGGK